MFSSSATPPGPPVESEALPDQMRGFEVSPEVFPRLGTLLQHIHVEESEVWFQVLRWVLILWVGAAGASGSCLCDYNMLLPLLRGQAGDSGGFGDSLVLSGPRSSVSSGWRCFVAGEESSSSSPPCSLTPTVILKLSQSKKKITPCITRQTSTPAANRIGRLGKGRRELRQTEWQRLSPGEEHQGISVEKPRNAVKMPNKTKKEKVISASLACPGHFSTEIRCGGCFFFCCWRLQTFYFTELMASSPASC